MAGWMFGPIGVRSPLVLLAVAGFAAGGCGSSTDVVDAPGTTIAPTSSDEVNFWCGDPATGRAPWALALDVTTGHLRWSVCRDALPAAVIGRSSGATVLWEQDGRGGGAIVAFDDAGTERWRHATTGDSPEVLFGANGVVVGRPTVDSLAAVDGEIRWSHPLADGTAIAVRSGLVVEVVGGPYASADASAHPADAGNATLRALDEVSGDVLWSTPVVVVPLPPPTQYSPTVGNTLIAVPSLSRGTMIVDVRTGAVLRTEEGVVLASGDWLTQIDPNTFRVQQVSRADTGEVLTGVSGQPLNWFRDAEHSLAVDDLLILRDGPGSQVFDMIDTATGETLWSLDDSWPLAESGNAVLATASTVLRLLDRRSGTAIWEYTSPSSSVSFQSAAFGNGIVLVAPGYLGD